MKLDAIVIAAHPDDAEISLGGTILRLVRAGRKVGVVDVTRGEMGTRGTRESRDAETLAATEALGLAQRINLEQPDGRVQVTIEARERLASILRQHEPELVFGHHIEDVHPDHRAAGHLAREAWYLSGLARLAELAGDESAARARRLYHFAGHVAFDPTFVVDIGSVWEDKIRAVRCYATQLEPATESDDGRHFLFGADILQRMETKARYWGEQISAAVGEPLFHAGPVPFNDPLLGLS